MKDKIFILLIFSILTVNVCALDSETRSIQPKDDTKTISAENEQKYIAAQRYLHGINTEVDYQKAINLFAGLALLGNTDALNALAGMCRQGLGLPEPQPEIARDFYLEAATKGNATAAYNLALMYKTAQGGEQDFDKAFEYAKLSLELGNDQTYYMLGYFYCKGFGTEQNYEQAVEMFAKGAELKQPSSTYFLGLCYLGGYGVAKDISKGKKLIEQAALLGNDHAVEFIVQERNKQYENPLEYQPEYNSVSNSADTETLQGVWQGKILCYDYGKQHVLEEYSLTLQLSSDENGGLSGLWVQSDSISMAVQAHRTDSLWQLEEMRYLQHWDRTWDLQTLRFALETDAGGDTILYGNLIQFSPQMVEPSSPLMIELRRVDIAEDKEEGALETENLLNTIKVYPNPFEQDIDLHITAEQAQRATVRVFDLSGKALHSETCDLTKGSQTKKISLGNLPAGTYAVSLKSETVNLQTLIIRNP